MKIEQTFVEQGKYEFRQGKYCAAINSFKNAIARNFQLIEAHYSCGLAAEKLGREKLAQECYTNVVKLRTEPVLDKIVPSDLSLTKTSSSIEANNNQLQKNSVFVYIALCFYLFTAILQTVLFIGNVTEKTNSHSSSHTNSQAAELVIDLSK